MINLPETYEIVKIFPYNGSWVIAPEGLSQEAEKVLLNINTLAALTNNSNVSSLFMTHQQLAEVNYLPIQSIVNAVQELKDYNILIKDSDGYLNLAFTPTGSMQ